MSALRNRAALAGDHSESAGNGTAACPVSRQPKRCDTVIASALLAALIAGWVMNFVSIRQLSLGLTILVAHASVRQT